MRKILNNLNFTINKNDSSQQKYQKLLRAVRRKVRKKELEREINGSFQSIRTKLLYPVSSYHSYIFSVLKSCSGNHSFGTGEMQKLVPIEVEIKRNGQIETGYSLQQEIFTKKYHNRSWRLSATQGDYLKIYDFSTLLSEACIENALFSFMENNNIKLQNIIHKEHNSEKKWSIILKLLKETANIKIVDKKEKSRSARIFETKKNISKKTQHAMLHNVFLQHYGYVELDNNVDLKKFAIWEKNFLDFADKFPIPIAKDHSFRIKRLGKHHANGMYFPHKKTLIFAIEHPESYAHELAHQIDYSYGNNNPLSKDIAFSKVVKCYKHIVSEKINSLPNSSQLKRRWFSSQVFNSNYYCQTMEIFARSFELYLYHKNIKNPLIDRHFFNDNLYPQNPEYIKKVISYIETHVLPKMSQ